MRIEGVLMNSPVANMKRLGLVGLLALLLAAGAVWLPAVADPGTPTGRDRQIAVTVATLLPRDHLSRHPVDDEISHRTLKLFLKNLDPLKVYFYQADVDAFTQRQSDLDDMVKRGDISFGVTVFQTFLARIDEKLKLVDELLATPQDFTMDEEMITDGDHAQYARTIEEMRDKWRKRIKYDLLVLKAEAKAPKKKDHHGAAKPQDLNTPEENAPKEFDLKEAVDKLSRRYHNFDKRMHQTDSDELLEMYLTAMTSAYDPHTNYMSPSTLENFDIQMRLNLEGIGAELQAEDGYTIVKKIVPGGAADKQGKLKAEDKITGVGQGKDGPFEDVVDMKLQDVVKLIRGKRGTVVRLKVVAPDDPQPKVVAITRETIQLKDKEAQAQVFPAGQKPNGQPYKLGVIKLPSFYMDMSGARLGMSDYKSTTRDVRRILERFNADGVDAMILDLRFNGGGSLQEAISLTGLFIDEGPVVQVKDADGQVQAYSDPEPGAAWKGPMVVLINKFSASASEILAGAIQDYHRGLIVGDRSTHGKGTVQSLMELGQQLFRLPNSPQMGALKITMSQFYRPDGDSTQKRGVLSDIELPSLTTHLDVGEADLDYPVEFDKIAALRYQKFNEVDKSVCDRLNYLSEQRRQGSKDFAKVLKNINRYLGQKERKVVTLNEQKFMAEREELNADKEQQKQLEELNDSSDQGIKRDYYLDEAMAITLDYVKLTLVAHNN
jgi:carboxyl-terminal processing protease